MPDKQSMDCAENAAENQEKRLDQLCRQLDQAIFNFIIPFAGLFVIDIGNISITLVREPEKAQVLIACRISNFSYSQGCAVETLLTEDPEIVGMAFFRAMLDRMRDFCVRKGLDYAHGLCDGI